MRTDRPDPCPHPTPPPPRLVGFLSRTVGFLAPRAQAGWLGRLAASAVEPDAAFASASALIRAWIEQRRLTALRRALPPTLDARLATAASLRHELDDERRPRLRALRQQAPAGERSRPWALGGAVLLVLAMLGEGYLLFGALGRLSPEEPYILFVVSVIVALIATRLPEWAGAAAVRWAARESPRCPPPVQWVAMGAAIALALGVVAVRAVAARDEPWTTQVALAAFATGLQAVLLTAAYLWGRETAVLDPTYASEYAAAQRAERRLARLDHAVADVRQRQEEIRRRWDAREAELLQRLRFAFLLWTPGGSSARGTAVIVSPEDRS